MNHSLALFEGYQIRRHYDEKTETWFFSVVDIIRVLLQQPDFQTTRKYWNKLKERLKKEGSESVTNCHRLKMEAADGKKYLTDAADVETLLRLIQIAESMEARGLPENEVAGRKGGGIAKKARLELEQKTGKSVISSENYLPSPSTKKLPGK